MWQEEGFGLGMDIMMKEGYAGGVGGGSFQADGTPKSMRAYPMTHEPLWGMPCPGCKGSPSVFRSAVYANAINDGRVDNTFYALIHRTTDFQMLSTVELVSRELHDLASVWRSHAHLSSGFVQPIVRGTSAVVDPRQPMAPPSTTVTGRVWVEPPPPSLNRSAASTYACLHVVLVHPSNFPAFLGVAIDRMPPETAHLATGAAAGGGVVLPLTRMFEGTSPEPLNATLWPNGTATFADIFALQGTNVYRIGCSVEVLKTHPPPGELCLSDCDFEASALEPWRPLMPSSDWGSHLQMVSDARTSLIADSSAAYQGRYAAKINVPNAMPIVLQLPINGKDFVTGGTVRVSLAVRASLAGTAVGVVWHNHSSVPPPTASNRMLTPAGGDWSHATWEVLCGGSAPSAKDFPLVFWAQAPAASASGVKVWVDAVSVVRAADAAASAPLVVA